MKKVNTITPSVFLHKAFKTIYDKFGIPKDEMIKNRKNRQAKYREPRQVITASYYCAYYGSKNNMSLADAASIFEQDHATLLNSIKIVNNELDTNVVFREKYEDIFSMVKQLNPKSRLNLS